MLEMEGGARTVDGAFDAAEAPLAPAATPALALTLAAVLAAPANPDVDADDAPRLAFCSVSVIAAGTLPMSRLAFLLLSHVPCKCTWCRVAFVVLSVREKSPMAGQWATKERADQDD
jgi:hypothetical protein